MLLGPRRLALWVQTTVVFDYGRPATTELNNLVVGGIIMVTFGICC